MSTATSRQARRHIRKLAEVERAHVARNQGMMRAAFNALSPEDLETLQAEHARFRQGASTLPDDMPAPLEEPLSDLGQAARTWAAGMKTREAWERWPHPPQGAARYFQAEAERAAECQAKVTDPEEQHALRVATALWRLDAALASLMVEGEAAASDDSR